MVNYFVVAKVVISLARQPDSPTTRQAISQAIELLWTRKRYHSKSSVELFHLNYQPINGKLFCPCQSCQHVWCGLSRHWPRQPDSPTSNSSDHFIVVVSCKSRRLRSPKPYVESKRSLCDFHTEIPPVNTYNIRAKEPHALTSAPVALRLRAHLTL